MNTFLPGIIGSIPFILLFLGLTFTKLKSYTVTFLVLVISSLFAYFFWKTGADIIFGSIVEGLLVALLPIIWVIFAAVFTYLVSVETGAMEIIKKFLIGITPDANVQVVIIAFCLGGFLESIAGFGTAVALPTAILISIGIRPLKAAVLALVANSVPVAFGALGIPVIVLSQITTLDLAALTRFVALQLLPFTILVPFALVIYNQGGIKGIRKSLVDVLLIGTSFSIAQTCTAFFIGPELAALMGSMVSLLLFIFYKQVSRQAEGRREYRALGWAVINYAILLVLVGLTRLVLRNYLSQPAFNLAIPIGGHAVNWDYLSTPGTLLFLSAFAGGLIQGIPFQKACQLILSAWQKIKYSAITIINIVALAKIMGYSGIISSVAVLIGSASGQWYPFFAPFIGALGTFLTGSDTSSNILLGELQRQTALKIGANVTWITASNTAGATAGKMISPQSISVAASTVGLEKEESEIIRTTIFFCLGYVAALGILIFCVNKFI
jgi:lactate permease